jgi:hypothetical protein
MSFPAGTRDADMKPYPRHLHDLGGLYDLAATPPYNLLDVAWGETERWGCQLFR